MIILGYINCLMCQAMCCFICIISIHTVVELELESVSYLLFSYLKVLRD